MMTSVPLPHGVWTPIDTGGASTVGFQPGGTAVVIFVGPAAPGPASQGVVVNVGATQEFAGVGAADAVWARPHGNYPGSVLVWH